MPPWKIGFLVLMSPIRQIGLFLVQSFCKIRIPVLVGSYGLSGSCVIQICYKGSVDFYKTFTLLHIKGTGTTRSVSEDKWINQLNALKVRGRELFRALFTSGMDFF
jgi:hypothetical protein